MSASTLPKRLSAPERKTLADVRGTHVKAALSPQPAATNQPLPQPAAANLRHPAAEARSRVMKLDTAAAAIGICASRLSHKFADGTLTLAEAEQLGTPYAAEFGHELVRRYSAERESATQRIRRILRAMRAVADELDQAVEAIEP